MSKKERASRRVAWRRIPQRVLQAGRFTLFGGMMLGLGMILYFMIQPIHRLHCSMHADNPGHVLQSGIEALVEASGSDMTGNYVNTGKGYSAVFHRKLNTYLAKKDDTLQVFPVFDPDKRPAIWCVLFERYQVVYVAYLPTGSSKSYEAFHAVIDNKERLDSVQGYVVPYRWEKERKQSYLELKKFLNHFTKVNGKVLPKLNEDKLLKRSKALAEQHFKYPWKGDRNNKLLMGTGILIMIMSMRIHAFRTIRVCNALLKRYYEAHGQGFPAKPPRSVKCFFAKTMQGYAESYEAELEEGKKLFWQHLAEADKKRRELQRIIAQHQSFLQEVERLQRALEEDHSLPEKIVLKVSGCIEIACDDRFPLNQRRAKLQEARQLIELNSTLEEERLKQQRCAYEQRLLDTVRKFAVDTLDINQREEIENCLNQYNNESPKRIKRRIYWLERALAVANMTIETQPEPTQVVKQQVAVQNNNDKPFVATADSLSVLLNIQELLPSEIDHDHAATIILWGLLKPGQRGRSYFNQRYITAQFMRKDVASKLGKRFDPQHYENALDWFLKQNVVFIPKVKRHQTVYSLNPHVKTATAAGQPVVQRILNFKDELTNLVGV